MGCPCPTYQCPTSALILNTFKQKSVPVLTDLNANVDLDLSFEIEEGVYVYQSCGVHFKGSFYVYGSENGDQKQIAKVADCGLKRIATLPFTHYGGACAATASNLLLCFDRNSWDDKTCQMASEPTGPFIEIPKSIEPHKWTRTAANES